MNEITAGNYVRLLVELCTEDGRWIIASAGTIGFVDNIIEREKGFNLDIIIDDIHVYLLPSCVTIASREEFLAQCLARSRN